MPKSSKSCPQHSGHVLLQGWLFASELVEAQCCFWEPCGAAGSPHPQLPVIMSVVAGVDQHAGYSHLGAASSTGFMAEMYQARGNDLDFTLLDVVQIHWGFKSLVTTQQLLQK